MAVGAAGGGAEVGSVGDLHSSQGGKQKRRGRDGGRRGLPVALVVLGLALLQMTAGLGYIGLAGSAGLVASAWVPRVRASIVVMLVCLAVAAVLTGAARPFRHGGPRSM